MVEKSGKLRLCAVAVLCLLWGGCSSSQPAKPDDKKKGAVSRPVARLVETFVMNTGGPVLGYAVDSERVVLARAGGRVSWYLLDGMFAEGDRIVKGSFPVSCTLLSNDGSVAGIRRNGTFWLSRVDRQLPLPYRLKQLRGARSVVLLPRRRLLAIGMKRAEVRLYNRRGAFAGRFNSGFKEVNYLWSAPDGSLLIYAGGNGGIGAYDPDSRTVRFMRKTLEPVVSGAFSRDGKLFVAGGLFGTIYLFDAVAGKFLRMQKFAQGAIRALRFVENGMLLAGYGTGGKGGFLLLSVPALRVQPLKFPAGHSSLWFTGGKDNMLISGDSRGAVRVYRLERAQQTVTNSRAADRAGKNSGPQNKKTGNK